MENKVVTLTHEELLILRENLPTLIQVFEEDLDEDTASVMRDILAKLY